MTYWTKTHDGDAIKEISKEEARERLAGWYKKAALNDIFNNNKSFRLYTPFRDIWTKTDDGFITQDYGIIE